MDELGARATGSRRRPRWLALLLFTLALLLAAGAAPAAELAVVTLDAAAGPQSVGALIVAMHQSPGGYSLFQ